MPFMSFGLLISVPATACGWASATARQAVKIFIQVATRGAKPSDAFVMFILMRSKLRNSACLATCFLPLLERLA
jgi:hypothetical protein